MLQRAREFQVIREAAGVNRIIPPAAGRGMHPDHDPVAHSCCHAAETFDGFFEILVEPGCARERFFRTDDEHQQRVALLKADDAEPDG